jgi:hypothetical protein
MFGLVLRALFPNASSEPWRATSDRDRLADIYIGSGQLDVAIEEPAYEALLDVRTNLGKDARRAVEAEAGIVIE